MINFENVIGQEPLIKRLQYAQPGHAYIFEGEPGMGKRALALAFAKALQCEGEGEATRPLLPCCHCLSCKVFESGNHPDMFYVKPTKTKSIGVDDIREQILAPMAEKPFRYRYKIFVISQAETMTPAAQNALLKTIEEPASFGIFLFLASHIRGFLKTVLSRCVVLKLKPVPDSLVAEYLGRQGAVNAQHAAALAGGNPGRGLKLAQSEDFAAMLNLAKETAFLPANPLEAYKLYPKFEAYKDSIQDLLDIMYMHYRERLLAGEDFARTTRGLELISKTKRVLQKNGNFQLAVELLLIGLTE